MPILRQCSNCHHYAISTNAHYATGSNGGMCLKANEIHSKFVAVDVNGCPATLYVQADHYCKAWTDTPTQL